jgi:hypothetical protein
MTLTLPLTSAAEDITTAVWIKETVNGELRAEMLKVTARTRAECAMICERKVECEAFVYDKTTSSCHVLPTIAVAVDDPTKTVSVYNLKGTGFTVCS